VLTARTRHILTASATSGLIAAALLVTPRAAAAPDPCATPPTPPTADAFVTCWDTSLTSAASSGSSSVALPLVDPSLYASSYNFTVQWGDGSSDTITTWNQAEATHTYAAPGRYWITITGDIDGFAFGGAPVKDAVKLIDVHQWGDLALGNTGNYFENAANMNFTATDAPDLSQTTSLNGAFLSATAFNSPIGHWDVSNVTSMYGTFVAAAAFNQPLAAWDVSNVQQMSMMFLDAVAFNQPLQAWDTSNVTSMLWMFFRASSFNNGGADLGSWDVSNVTVFANMFESAASFNADVAGWQIGTGVSMHSMFNSATSFNRNLAAWDMSGVTDISSMFANASAFNNGGQDLTWDGDLASVTNMNSTFAAATSFNQPIGEWDVSAVTNMGQMFAGAGSFSRDLSGWGPTSVVAGASGGMNGMLDNSGLTTAQYDALLNSWAGQNLASGLTLGASSLAYSYAASTAREGALAGALGWTINDLGLVQAGARTMQGPDTLYGRSSPPFAVTFTNEGTADISLASPGVTISGTDAAAFSVAVDSCSGATVPAAGSCIVTVIFTPTRVGLQEASVRFASANPGVDPGWVSAGIAGMGVAPDPRDDVQPVSPSNPSVTYPDVSDRMSWRRSRAPVLAVGQGSAVSPQVTGLPANARLRTRVRLGGEWMAIGSSRSDARGDAAVHPFTVLEPGRYLMRVSVVGGRDWYLKVRTPAPP
jgi:hypothetical protein